MEHRIILGVIALLAASTAYGWKPAAPFEPDYRLKMSPKIELNLDVAGNQIIGQFVKPKAAKATTAAATKGQESEARPAVCVDAFTSLRDESRGRRAESVTFKMEIPADVRREAGIDRAAHYLALVVHTDTDLKTRAVSSQGQAIFINDAGDTVGKPFAFDAGKAHPAFAPNGNLGKVLGQAVLRCPEAEED